VEKVKLACVFEAGRALDERKAEEIDVEIDIRLDFSGDGRDVMDTAGHGRLLWKTHNQDFPGRASRPSVNGLSRKSDRRRRFRPAAGAAAGRKIAIHATAAVDGGTRDAGVSARRRRIAARASSAEAKRLASRSQT